MRNKILTVLGAVLVFGIIMYVLGLKLTKEELQTGISAAAEPIFCLGGDKIGIHCAAGATPITNSFLMTLFVDLLLGLTAMFAASRMQLIPRGFQNVIEAIVEGFYNFAQDIDRKNVAKFFPMCATILFFVLYSNLFALVPGVGSIGLCTPVHHAAAAPAEDGHAVEGAAAAEVELTVHPSPVFSGLLGYCDGEVVLVPFLRSPSADLNMTAALALISVITIQVFGIQALGLGYFVKFFNFREGGMGFLVGLIELISEIARVISFSFRLFGNIFAGEVVLLVMGFLFPYLLPLPFYGLELFVAAMQAIIFSVLTLIYMSLATQAHGGHDEHAHDGPVAAEAIDLPAHTAH